MTVLAILTTALLTALPTPSEIRSDVEANPYRPAPAAATLDTAAKKPKDTTPVATAKPVPNAAPTKASPTPPGPAATTAQTAGTWTIQLVAISNADAARTEQKRLEKIVGSAVDIVVEPPMNKLRWGSFATKEEAENAKAALKAKSVDGFVVRR